MTFIATKLFHKAGEGSGGGGGGGDQHNLGWYATESALTTAHPTASNGDYAIVGSTDTVWVWDGDTNAWKDTDTKGQVTSVNGQTGAVTVDTLPSQTGNSGKFLTTDGTDASWAAVDALPSQTGNSGKFLTTNGTNASWTSNLKIGNAVKVSNSSITMGTLSVVVGGSASATQSAAIAIGYGSDSSAMKGVAVGADSAVASTYGCAYGGGARIGNSATHAVQIGSTGSVTTNSDANTFKVANANGNFEIMSADGTIPEARLADTTNAQQGDVLTLDANGDAVWQAASGGQQIQYSTMPNAAENAGNIIQYTGETSAAEPVFTVTFETITDAMEIIDPATFRDAINTELMNNDNVELVEGCSIGCGYNAGQELLELYINDIDSNQYYVSWMGLSNIADVGVTINETSNNFATDYTCDSLGSSSPYTNGYFYKSVSGSGVRFISDPNFVEIVDPQLFYQTIENLAAPLDDGSSMRIEVHFMGGYNISLFIEYSDGTMLTVSDQNVSDPENEWGIRVYDPYSMGTANSYIAYTSAVGPIFVNNTNSSVYTVVDPTLFLSSIETAIGTTLPDFSDIYIEITDNGGSYDLYISVTLPDTSQGPTGTATIINPETDFGITITALNFPANGNIEYLKNDTGGSYTWQQVNVQPITADSIAPTTGLADGNYNLRLTIVDGVPTLSWVAE